MSLSSANQVLVLPELLELILASLCQRDLLLAQRVSRRWRQTIANSPLLQKKLFLQATRTCPLAPGDERIQLNPLINHFFPAFAQINALDPWYNWVDDFDHQGFGIVSMRNQEWYQSEDRRAVFLRPEASWRRMFITDPPPRLGRLHMRLEGCGCYRHTLDGELNSKYQHFNEDPGARMGFIWDVVAFILDDLPGSDFFLQWSHVHEKAIWQHKRTLEIHIDTEHHWDCYDSASAYQDSGLQVVEYKDLVEYPEYAGRVGTISDEAAPLSVLAKHNNSEKEDADESELTGGMTELEIEDRSGKQAKDDRTARVESAGNTV
ncbi:hypothetical protein BJX64DRAFT_288803 [Aspergillus heterothallicus]